MAPPRIIVVGAGFGGIGAAIELLEHGYSDVTLLERADEIGGVWRDNTYPGAACDVPSNLYSWSFAPNPDWARRYSGQADILGYLRRVAEAKGVRRLVRTGVEVTAAAYDDETATWRVETRTGETLVCDFLVMAVGQLSRPVVPDLPGQGSFAGAAFHSACWDHDVDLRGKRVAVVGTGASAIQFVPAIEPVADHVTVFQRSAPYVVPKPDIAYSGRRRDLYRRLPVTQALGRNLTWVLSEQLNKSLTGTAPMKRVMEAAWHALLRAQVRDPDLRARLRPDYPLGCKRLLFSNDWYPALVQPNVDVVTAGVTEVLPHGVRSADGSVHEADVIIYGTGFAATDFLAPMKVQGARGVSLDEVWAQGAHAHLGIAVPGFPNLGIVYGPNTNLGGSSIIAMMEAQAGYIRQLVELLPPGGGSVEVRPEAAARFDEEMQRRLADSVWAGCRSWYREDGGRVTTNWPGQVREYQQRTTRVARADVDVRPR